jgi:hypothetical protein
MRTKQPGAPDRRPILSLILFTHTMSRTESKGLPIDVPFDLLYFLHAQRCVQKVRGSRSMSHSIFYTFYIRSAKDSCLTFNVLFMHNNHQRMKRKGHLYTYIHIQVLRKTIFIQVYKLTEVCCSLQKKYYNRS